jgi:2-polyprenyl-3-methyl-5-hydroxy-6-metoxy-1,4-benzoquinol methylase
MIQCPICCERSGLNLVEVWKDYKFYNCSACDVVFSDPMRNPGSGWYEESEDYTFWRIFGQKLEWRHKQFLHDRKVNGNYLLDIGCGPGLFLHEAQKMGYTVTGIDFSREMIGAAKERFRFDEVYPVSLEDFITSHPNKKFDVITFFEVLEHLDDPNSFIRLLKSCLKPEGYIALSVPNRERFLEWMGEGDYPPHHLTRWNSSSIFRFFERHGFEIVKMVIQSLDTEDIERFLKGKIRFRIAYSTIQKGMTSHNEKLINYAAVLMQVKDYTFKGIATLFIPFLKFLKLQGTGIYCLARLKPIESGAKP